MSKYLTQWGLYQINPDRTEGYSNFFNTYEEALDAVLVLWEYYILEQTYELED